MNIRESRVQQIQYTSYPDAVAWDFLKNYTAAWEKYVEEVKSGYNPEDVVDRTMIPPRIFTKWPSCGPKPASKDGEGAPGECCPFGALATTNTCTASTTPWAWST